MNNYEMILFIILTLTLVVFTIAALFFCKFVSYTGETFHEIHQKLKEYEFLRSQLDSPNANINNILKNRDTENEIRPPLHYKCKESEAQKAAKAYLDCKKNIDKAAAEKETQQLRNQASVIGLTKNDIDFILATSVRCSSKPSDAKQDKTKKPSSFADDINEFMSGVSAEEMKEGARDLFSKIISETPTYHPIETPFGEAYPLMSGDSINADMLKIVLTVKAAKGVLLFETKAGNYIKPHPNWIKSLSDGGKAYYEKWRFYTLI